MTQVRVPGLIGSNPLSFLATIGLLHVLDEAAGDERVAPRLSWQDDGWCAVLHDVEDLDMAAAVVRDCQRWLRNPLLRFGYPKLEKKGVKAFRGLTPPVGALRQFLKDGIRRGDWKAIDLAGGLMTETATESIHDARQPSSDDFASIDCPFEENGISDRNALQTSFDFTARNSQFLDQARLIGEMIDETLVSNALDGQRFAVEARSLGWDPSADRPAALYSYGSAPNPTLEWLAFRGLGAFPVVGDGVTRQTTACQGRRKNGTFAWPLWSPPCRPRTVRSLVAYRWSTPPNPARLKAMGVLHVFCVDLAKAADGYTGVFSPTRVL